jgi:hypothetical protein
MDHERVVRKIFDNEPEGRKRHGRHKLRWLEDVEKYLGR